MPLDGIRNSPNLICCLSGSDGTYPLGFQSVPRSPATFRWTQEVGRPARAEFIKFLFCIGGRSGTLAPKAEDSHRRNQALC